MAANGNRKRTKPCSNCKKNKVKCEYLNSLPCQRCARHSLKCYYLDGRPPRNDEASPSLETNPNAVEAILPSSSEPFGWSNSVDVRLNTHESALESVLSILKSNQIQQQQQINLLQQRIKQYSSAELNPRVTLPSMKELSFQAQEHEALKVQKSSEVRDFRTAEVLSLQEAEALVNIFAEKFAPRLFGYDIGLLKVQDLWQESPLLLVSICTVACAHHAYLGSKYDSLKQSFDYFASQSLIKEVESTQIEHVILGLIIGALWLESGQMFISVAIQLARLNMIDRKLASPHSPQSPPLQRLWYLLYIVDGNQNLTFSKSPSIHECSEPLLRNARADTIKELADVSLRKILLENQNPDNRLINRRQLHLLNEVDHQKISISGSALNEVRLLSQLEYHMAMESVFNTSQATIEPDNYNVSLEASFALLEPSKFGVPWQSNLTLDKWMISWAITLQNLDFQSDPWCLKSTLLYYNFARMHINTKPLLTGTKSTIFNGASENLISLWHSAPNSDSDNLSMEDKRNASCEISLSAAHSLLKLGIEDKDLRSIYQFLPIHVHVMLYYASLVLLNPAAVMQRDAPSCRKTLRDRFKLVSKFRQVLLETPLSDLEFRSKILKSLSQILDTFTKRYGNVLAQEGNNISPRVELLDDDTHNSDESKPRSILAWPGTNHGHP